MAFVKNIFLFCFSVSFCLIPFRVGGQNVKDKAKKWVQVSGNFGVYGDFYRMNADSSGAVAPRRPDALGRLVLDFSVDIKDFSLPITFALPSGRFGTLIPQVPTLPNAPWENFRQMMKDPLNRVGIAPTYKWCKVMLGSQIPQYSELSVGDLAVFGAGIALNPKKFRFSCFAGTSQLAIEADSVRNIEGIYARKIYSAKLGFGHEDSSHFYLIGSKMLDDTSSLLYKPTMLKPQTGILASIDFRINFGKKLYLKGEIAGSAFTRDERSNELPPFTPTIPKSVFNPKESSRADYASILSIGMDWKNFGLKTTGRYYGDGFVTMGYPFMQMDRLEVTLDPRLMLFKNKFQLSWSVGRRVNNLSGIMAATTTQTIGSANTNIQLTESFSVSGSYSNFGFRNSVINDTFRLEMVTNSWSVSPTYNLTTKKSLHNFMMTYAQNEFRDFNVVSGAINDNDAINGVFSYTLSLVNSPFMAGALFSYFENQTSYGKLLTQSVNATLGYKFFKKKLATTAGLTFSDNKIDNGSSGYQVMSNVGIKYTVKKKIQFALNGSINLFEFGDTRPGISYREDLLRTSITYKL